MRIALASLGLLTLASFSTPPWPSADYITGRNYEKALQVYSGLVERGWACYVTAHNQQEPSRWSTDRRNLTRAKAGLRAMLTTEVWLAVASVTCSGTVDVLDEVDLLNMSGAPTNWFDVTPWAGLSTDTNGWRLWENILTNVVYTYALNTGLQEASSWSACHIDTNCLTSWEEGAPELQPATYPIGPGWSGLVKWTDAGAMLGNYRKTRFKGGLFVSTNAFPRPTLAALAPEDYASDNKDPICTLYPWPESIGCYGTIGSGAEEHATAADSIGTLLTVPDWDERFWVDPSDPCTYADGACYEMRVDPTGDGEECSPAYQHSGGFVNFANFGPLPVVVIADWREAFSYP